MNRERRWAVRVLGAGAALALSLAAAACSPEPGSEAGRTDKDAETVNPETQWGNNRTPDYEQSQTLPESFPSNVFAFPDDLVIVDAGERGEQQWYLVLRSSDLERANAAWAQIISSNGFVVSDESTNVEGGPVATLAGGPLSVSAQHIPQSDGSVLLSYDILRWAAPEALAEAD